MNSEDEREQLPLGKSGQVARRRRPGFTLGLAVAGGSFRRVLRTPALRRGGCRARRPGDRPPAVPPYPAAAPASTTTKAVTRRVRCADAVKVSQSPGRGTPRMSLAQTHNYLYPNYDGQ